MHNIIHNLPALNELALLHHLLPKFFFSIPLGLNNMTSQSQKKRGHKNPSFIRGPLCPEDCGSDYKYGLPTSSEESSSDSYESVILEDLDLYDNGCVC